MMNKAINDFAKLFFNTLTDDEKVMFYNAVLSQFKDTDSGRYGKAFEINVKHYLNGNRGNVNKVSAKGKIDVISKGIKYEIKSNCGEINKGIEKNDYIIYTMDNETDYARPQNAFVIPADEFVALVKMLGLMRTKKSTNGELKVTIQSYRNSKKKMLGFAQALANYPTLDEHLAIAEDL